MAIERGVFLRQDLLTIEQGYLVRYGLAGSTFGLLSSRRGVQVMGLSPIFPAEAMPVVLAMLRRAWMQSESLAKAPPGEKQHAISEGDFELDAAMIPTPNPVPAPIVNADPVPRQPGGRVILAS